MENFRAPRTLGTKKEQIQQQQPEADVVLQNAEARLADAITRLQELTSLPLSQRLWQHSLLRAAREEYIEAERAVKHARTNHESSDQYIH